ncbi:MAG: M1 family metallopeptidase [Clostridia bacterium]|nr:M1 family metallopeptidase [Clostridia bacterium]
MLKKRITILLLALILLLTLSLSCCGQPNLNKVSKDLDNYSVSATFDDKNMVLSAVQVVEFTNRGQVTVDCVKFHIYANAYSQDNCSSVVMQDDRLSAYYNGYSYGSISFDSVSVNNETCAYIIEGDNEDILNIPLRTPLASNKSVKITMVYEVNLANIRHRLGYGDNTVNFGNCFPILCVLCEGAYRCHSYTPIGDPFLSDVANYQVSLTVPSTYQVAHTGSLTDKSQKDALTTYLVNALAVREFAFVLSQSFTTLCGEHSNGTNSYMYYNDPSAQSTLELITEAVAYFSKLFCQYPYPNLSVVQTDLCYGGMEYPALVMVAVIDDVAQYRHTVVHEIAHQWLYALVGNDQINDAWMDEGLVEFVTAMFFDNHPQYELTMDSIMSSNYANYAVYIDVKTSFAKDVDTSMNRSIYEYSNWQEYAYINYVKGCIMFYEIYKTMGNVKFNKALNRYVSQYGFAIATSADMIECFSLVQGSDLNSLFKAYLLGEDVLARAPKTP